MKNNDLQQATTSAFFVSNTSKERPLANWPGRIIVVFLLTIVFSLTVLASGSLFPSPSPYGDESPTKSVLDQQSFLTNAWSIGVNPGINEEVPAFAATTILTVILTFGAASLFQNKELRKNTGVLTVAALIASVAVAFLFTAAHARRGDYTPATYLLAFTFATAAQFANQITGLFISWIPHLAHNISVVVATQLSLSVGVANIFLAIPLSKSFVHELKESKARFLSDISVFKLVAKQRWNS